VGSFAVKDHKRGYAKCSACEQFVDIQNHRCFIQKAPTPQKERELKKTEVTATASQGRRRSSRGRRQRL